MIFKFELAQLVIHVADHQPKPVEGALPKLISLTTDCPLKMVIIT